MENEKCKISQLLNLENHENGEIYYLLNSYNFWESEYNLSSVNSLVVKNVLHSNLKKVNKIKNLNKGIHQNFDFNSRDINSAGDIVKEEDLADHNNGRYHADIFCNIVSSLLHDDTVDATNMLDFTDENLKLADSHKSHKHFTCNICNMRFAETSNLKEHQLTHTDDKPFICDMCKKTFVRKDLPSILI